MPLLLSLVYGVATTDMKTNKNGIWDVIVIGGGPAGMMAAGRAAERGKSVLLLEKNQAPGKKLLITGGGRCNVTNNKDMRSIAMQYKGSDQFLMSAFAQYDVAKTLAFFNKRGMKTKEEAEGRIFPSSNTAQSVLDVLVAYMRAGNVTVHTHVDVVGCSYEPTQKVFIIQPKKGKALRSLACIVATGGTSRPDTGSTGEGFAWLKAMGHTIAENNMALVPIAIKNGWVKRMAGVTLHDIKLTVLQDGARQFAHKGKLLFTHVGISGPTVLHMSKDVGELLSHGDVIIELDVFPHYDAGTLRGRLQTMLADEHNKKLKNTLPAFMTAALVPELLALADVDGETANHSVRHEDRLKLVACMKAMPIHVKGLLGAHKAIVSDGGVTTKEIDSKTMQSRIVPGLYLVGDVLHISRPAGGYSLQLCWTTGFVAGSHA